MNNQNATFAIYHDRKEIRQAVRSFTKLGFDESDLWAFQARESGSKDFSKVQKFHFTKGAIGGAIVGLILVGVFLSIADRELLSSRWLILGIVLIGGLFGAAAGTLIGIGTPDPTAKRYGQYLDSGGILLSVHSETPEQIQQAREVLLATGGQDIHVMNEFKTWEKANMERLDLEKFRHASALDQ